MDGVNYVHKSNVARHVKSGSLHDWAKKQFEKESAATGESSESPTTSTNSRATPTFDQLIDQCIGKCSGNPFFIMGYHDFFSGNLSLGYHCGPLF